MDKFFGVTVSAGKDVPVAIPAGHILRITQIAIADAAHKVTLNVVVEGNTFAVATLNGAAKIFQVNTSVVFSPDQSPKLQAKGNGTLHVTGTLTNIGDTHMDDDDDDLQEAEPSDDGLDADAASNLKDLANKSKAAAAATSSPKQAPAAAAAATSSPKQSPKQAPAAVPAKKQEESDDSDFDEEGLDDFDDEGLLPEDFEDDEGMFGDLDEEDLDGLDDEDDFSDDEESEDLAPVKQSPKQGGAASPNNNNKSATPASNNAKNAGSPAGRPSGNNNNNNSANKNASSSPNNNNSNQRPSFGGRGGAAGSPNGAGRGGAFSPSRGRGFGTPGGR